MDTKHIRRITSRVTAGLAGDVVEVGFGAGNNLAYLPAWVTRLLAVEPRNRVAPDENVRRWQARLNRLQQRLVGGCNFLP